MTRTRGEGRSPAEKAQGVFATAEYRKTQKARQKAEEEAWEARSGPVTFTYAGIVEEEDSEPPKQHGHRGIPSFQCYCGRFAKVIKARHGVYSGNGTVDLITVNCSRCGEVTVTI